MCWGLFARVSVGVIVKDFKIKSFLIMVASEFNIKRRIGERRGKEEEGQGGGRETGSPWRQRLGGSSTSH